jgi:hypothetical protein
VLYGFYLYDEWLPNRYPRGLPVCTHHQKTLIDLDPLSAKRRLLLPEQPREYPSVICTQVSHHTVYLRHYPLLTSNVRQTHLLSQQLLLVLPVGFFRKILFAKLVVLLHLAVLGNRIVHVAGEERRGVGTAMRAKRLS